MKKYYIQEGLAQKQEPGKEKKRKEFYSIVGEFGFLVEQIVYSDAMWEHPL